MQMNTEMLVAHDDRPDHSTEINLIGWHGLRQIAMG